MTRTEASSPSPHRTFKPEMEELIADRLAVFLESEGAYRRQDDADPEIVHGIRVASRRLRAALDASGDTLPTPWFKPLRKAVKRSASALGEVRDRDVQLAFLEKQRKKAKKRERAGIDRLVARLTRERDEATAGMLGKLERRANRAALDDAARELGIETGSGEERS